MWDIFFYAIIAIIYFIDINYFLRVIFVFVWTKFMQKKTKPMNETTIYGICFTQDLDLVLSHMNNARYLREIDFARFHYFIQTEMFYLMGKMGATVVLGASSTRYRRPIPFLMTYKIMTKLIYWDEKSLYFEHKFINLRNNFIHTTIFSKQTTIGLKISLTEFLKKFEPEIRLPEINEDLRLWLESMEYNSQKLKKKD
ncbi:protein THEM6-like [Vespa crabro]|uniref:protein THEM6-like n=1 Tax=Vespa crabro TaxID=7445 RepID=UPI001F004F35|nr:protein THEM6-like [Vespa crabro]